MPAETDARSTRGTTLWPPAPPEFSKVALPDCLLVPLSAKSGAQPKAKPRGTKLRPGDPVVESPAESSHVPLAPAAGTLGEIRPIRLTTGRAATAVELFPSGDTDETSPPAKPFGETDDPFSLISGLERIRAAGVWADRHAHLHDPG
jgi:Na+-translocating ferredoxin:NAD+ oxidoreductase RnfC subunit